MDGRQNLLRAIRFQSPERIPRVFWRWGANDLQALDFGPLTDRVNGTHERDEFGCVWERPRGRTIGFVVHHPLAEESWFASYRWPDPDDPRRFAHLREQAQAIREKGRAVSCNYLAMLWERLWFLLGLEAAFVRLWEDPDWIAELLDRLAEFQIRLLTNAQDATGNLIDLWTSTDDWGLQTGPFLPVSTFEALFVPRYQRIFSACHARGMASYLHSDGKMAAYLPGLIRAGLDVLQVEDVQVKGIPALAEHRGGICFQCTLDAQSTMPSGDRDRIAQEARQIVGNLATSRGGLIASIYWDPASCGVSQEVQSLGVSEYEAACDEFRAGIAAERLKEHP